jgi:acyl-CoA reductase-like NAD-dependent aldehyde dehydrogenase
MLELADPGLLKTRNLIGGKWIDAEDGRTLEVRNPATGATLARVASVGAA